MAWLVTVFKKMIYKYLMETLGHTDFQVWLHFCDLPPYAERENKPSAFLPTFCLCRWQESNPGRQRNKRVRYPLLHCLAASTTKYQTFSLKCLKIMDQTNCGTSYKLKEPYRNQLRLVDSQEPRTTAWSSRAVKVLPRGTCWGFDTGHDPEEQNFII